MSIISLGGVKYPIIGPVQRVTLDSRGYPAPTPESGQLNEVNYNHISIVSQRGPLGIGFKNSFDARHIWDAEADTRWSDCITLPRLKTTTTIDETEPIEFHVLAEAVGKLFMGGDAVDDAAGKAFGTEPLMYFDGTNWVSAGVSAGASSGSDGSAWTSPLQITGVVEFNGTAYVIYKNEVNHNGTGDRTHQCASSTDGTTWTRKATAGTLGANAYFLTTEGTKMWSAVGTTTVRIKHSTDGITWTTTTPSIGSTGRARGLVALTDGAATPAIDIWMTTPDGLWHYDVSADLAALREPFSNRQSAYTGQLLATPHGLVYSDGPNVFVYNYNGGNKTRVMIGPQGVNDGLPLAKQGDITALAYDSILDQLAVTIGGQDGSHYGCIYIYDFTTSLWSCQYKNSTANRVAFALFYSSRTAGVNKLHFVEDSATANDSDAFYLDYISEHPDVQTAATYALTGQITTSMFDGHSWLTSKAWYRLGMVTESPTSGETITHKYALDGGSLDAGTSAYTTTRVLQTFNIAGTGFVINSELTLARSATTTRTPRIRRFGWFYRSVARETSGRPVQMFKALLSRDPTDLARVKGGLKPEDVLTNVLAHVVSPTVQALEYSEGNTILSISVIVLGAKLQQYTLDNVITVVAAQHQRISSGFAPVEVTMAAAVPQA